MSDSPLWRPGRIGPMELKNRVIRSATNEHLSQPDGQLTTASGPAAPSVWKSCCAPGMG